MRLIDADKLPLDIEHEDIDDAPTIDAVEVKHGEWFGVHEYIDHLEKVTGEKFQISNLYDGCNFCNNCWYSFPRKYNYCPNCGARMDGEVKNDGN